MISLWLCNCTCIRSLVLSMLTFTLRNSMHCVFANNIVPMNNSTESRALLFEKALRGQGEGDSWQGTLIT